jgi:hypothetical protein
MRTTLELDDDLMSAARKLARQRGVSLGQVISELARQSLESKAPQEVRNGFPLLARRRTVPKPDMDLVNRLRDET